MTRCILGFPQHVCIHNSTSSSPCTSRLKASIMNFTSSWSFPYVLAMKWKVGSSIWMHLQPASRSNNNSLFMASAMSQMTCRLSLYFWGVDVQKQGHHLGATGSELEGLARLSLRDAPHFRIVEGA